MLHPFSVARLVASLALATPAVQAVVHDYAVPDGSGRALRLNVPDDLAVVRGILIRGNGASGDAREFATDPELVAFARSIDFCVLGTGYWYNFSDALGSELTSFTEGIAQLATQSGHPELVHAPWLPMGHSNGGQMSYGLNALRPERVIAMVVSKGAYYVTTRPNAAALRTPGLLVAGEADTAVRRASIRDLYEGNRPRGALWAWVEEEGTGHAEADSAELIRLFIAECVRLRLPAMADPRLGPVPLREVAEESGWLVEPSSDKAGFARIHAYADYSGDRRSAGWLPSERVAMIFRAFASHRKANGRAVIEGAGSTVIAAGTPLACRLTTPAGEWSAIELYEGATLVARFAPTDPELVFRQIVARPGYWSFHSVVSHADGTQQTTMPRRIFVTAPGPRFVGQPATSAAPVGGTVALSVSGRASTGETVAEYRWRRNGRELTGAAAATFTLEALQPVDAGLYDAAIATSATVLSDPAIVGVLTTAKVTGMAREVGSDLTPRPGGNTYDQVLLEGAAASVTADPGQITRISFVDLSDDIVQVEFSGAGTLTLCLDNASGPAPTANYLQPNVSYMKGHAGIVIAGADETTNVSVFSVGSITAINQSLFRSDVRYDGGADLAFIAIQSSNGRFGGVRAANASFFDTRGLTGVYAPGVRFAGPVFVGEICAADSALPVFLLGEAADTRCTGGDFAQLNGSSVRVSGIDRLRFTDGMTSHGGLLPAQSNAARLEQDGLDVTQLLTSAAPQP